ncbi:hypothetical protein AVEN_85501-1 [Araneus ventricosus]|uniref:Uncharacterized protein n=1 Tax=Araneus ventricosus TaxID=182803 RepID=A0A4Y2GVY0_ARAVE|nr:hypothetical protein AVEN_85501-1 [Araneus ventricosus]
MTGDAQRRYDWYNFIMNRLEVQPTFLADIIWTDEAYFSRNTMYNKQNIHFWQLVNLRCAVEVRHQVRWSINVWCGIFNDWPGISRRHVNGIPILVTSEGRNIRFSKGFAVE